MHGTGLPNGDELDAGSSGGAGFSARVEMDAVVVCAGELDPATSPNLRLALQRAQGLRPDRLVVDMSGVSFFGASAIGEFVRARASSRDAGGDLVLRSVSSLGHRVLEIVGFVNLTDREPVDTEDGDSDAARRGAELTTAWATACATPRYGSAPMEFDASEMLSTITELLDGARPAPPGDDLPSAAADVGPPASATGVLQLWALNDVVHAWIDAHGVGTEGSGRRALQHSGVEAALAGMASSLLAELERATLLDPLTGLLNRRALDRDLVEALATARRHSHSLSVVVIDVIGLKATNDEFGHAAGDEVLRVVAANLMSMLRAEDHAYRIGGDEFVLLLPELRPEDVHVVMDRAVMGAPGAFTWGCSWMTGDDDDGRTDDERAGRMLSLADQRMLAYRSQRASGQVDRPIDLEAEVSSPTSTEKTVALAGEFTAANRASARLEEAKGLIAETFGVTIAEASSMLLRFASTQTQPMVALAAALVNREMDMARLAEYGPRASAPVRGDSGPAATAHRSSAEGD